MSTSSRLNRRQVVFGIGGAVAGFAFLGCEARHDGAVGGEQSAATGPGAVLAQLDLVTRDTMAGVISFLVPGNDVYSRWQGVSLAEPGGLAARGDEFLAFYLNKYFPVTPLSQSIVSALTSKLSAITLPLPAGMSSFVSPASSGVLANYGALYDAVLQTEDSTLPLAPIVAALLNFLAVSVRASSVLGPFLTPFSRLTWQEKGEVWRRFEVLVPDYFSPGSPVSLLPASDDPDIVRSLGGLLDYASGVIPPLATFGSYSEWSVFDAATRTERARPVGYVLSNYGGPADGWDEFLGYYQGRRSAVDA